MSASDIIIEFFENKRNLGQIVNICKYFFGNKKEIVNWEPIHISIFLTYRCNFSCDMCLTHSKKFSNPWGQTETKDMDFELFKQILNRYKNAWGINLIGNGESLLHKDFFKMIDYASNKMKMNVYSSSNGILVGEHIEEIINSSLKSFNISINGHNSKEFNRITGMPPKMFDVICKNTLDLVKKKREKKSRLKIVATFILDQENYKYINDIINFAEKLGVDEFDFFNFLPVPINGFSAKERCLYADDKEVSKIFELVNYLPPNIRKKVILPPLLERDMVLNKYCSTPFFNLNVDGDGNIGGCSCQLLNLSKNGKFSEETDPWNSQHFREFRRRFVDNSLPLIEPCKSCYNNSGYNRAFYNRSIWSYIKYRISHPLYKI